MLTVRYNGKKVLDNINLDVEEGDTIGIIGRSGAGKTVLLNVLRGLDERSRRRDRSSIIRRAATAAAG